MKLRTSGFLLFLFIPVVLVLLLAQPLGPLPSLVLGVAFMLGHRFVAQPFSERHRMERCLWCGRNLPQEFGEHEPDPSPVLGERRGDLPRGLEGRGRDRSPGLSERAPITGPDGTIVEYRTCALSVRDCARRWLGLHRLATDHALLIRLGIVLPLLNLLLADLARSFFGRSWMSHEAAALLFRGVIALTVVSISFLYLQRRPPDGEWSTPTGRFPFPPHNLSLLGAGWTLWIFRVVGIWWILVGGHALLSRL